MNQKPCESLKCELWNKCASPLIEVTGSSSPDLLVIGEAPTAEDDGQRGNLLGDAGELLRTILKQVGFDLKKVAFTNTVKCRPKQEKYGKVVNREPIPAEIKDCKPFLLADIDKLKPKSILLLGAVAFKAVTGMTGITANRGRVIEQDGMLIVPTFHPANVLRDPTFLDCFVKDLETVYQELYVGKAEIRPVSYTLMETKSDLKRLIISASNAEEMSFDLETSSLNPHMEDSQIVCAAISFQECESFVIPLYNKDMIFIGKDLQYAKDVLRVLMESDLPKIAHNGKFDATWLLQVEGIATCNFIADTMLMQFLLTEQAGTHGLDWLAWRYTDMGGYDLPLEEYKSHNKECDPKRGGSYRNIPWSILAPYAGMDTDCTLRCYHKLKGLLC